MRLRQFFVVILFVFVILSLALVVTAQVASQCVLPNLYMISWWPGEGNANDIYGIFPGTLIGGTTFASGKVGQAFSLDGVNDYFNTSYNPTHPDITIDAWVKPNSVSSGSITVYAWMDGLYAYSDILYIVNGKLRFYMWDGGPKTVESITTLVPGNWYHVAGTWFGGNEMKIYVNGVIEGTLSNVGGRWAGGNRFLVGKNNGLAGYFNGLIDEVHVYNRVLSANDIKAIYNAGSAGVCKGSEAPPVVDPDTSSSLCASKGYVWVNNQCCGDDGANDNYAGCVAGKLDSDRDGIIDKNDKCPNTPPTEAGEVYTNQSSAFYGCSSSEGAFCLIKGEGAICQSGPLCSTNPIYNDQQNNVACDSITCNAYGSCSVQTACTPCPVQSCNQFDSYFKGCYLDQAGLPTEYRDYIETYQVCSQGVCQEQQCDYNVIAPTTQKDSDSDGITDFCDNTPCGQNTFLGSRALDSVGCFCEGNFTDCNQDLGNGCERNVNLEGTCPGIPRCTIPATTIPLASGQTCMGPASENALGGIICTAGQYFCYGLCRDVSCDKPTELCADPNDYDCDGMSNDYEFKYGLAVFDPIDKDHDPDLEGLLNFKEFEYLTNPFNPDTDGDGLSDLDEINVTDPLNPDTDGDGLIDGDEVFYLTSPVEQDMDKDGLSDGDEIQAILDWIGIADKNAIKSFIQKDGCLIGDGCVEDELNGLDGLKNGPFDPDTDGDGLSDFEEVKGINGLISNPFDPENTCSFECSVWSPDPCEEDQAQTRTCSQGTNCAGISYKPKESQQCRLGFTGAEEKVPFFTNINIIVTLVIILSYYLVTLIKSKKP